MRQALLCAAVAAMLGQPDDAAHTLSCRSINSWEEHAWGVHCDLTCRRLHPCLPVKRGAAISAVSPDESRLAWVCLYLQTATSCRRRHCLACHAWLAPVQHHIQGAVASPLSMMAFLQRNVFADIIKRKEVMALPNLAEDLAYVSLLCVLGEHICIARSLLHVTADFLAKVSRLVATFRPRRLALRGSSPSPSAAAVRRDITFFTRLLSA